jgi:hypothetical protein
LHKTKQTKASSFARIQIVRGVEQALDLVVALLIQRMRVSQFGVVRINGA